MSIEFLAIHGLTQAPRAHNAFHWSASVGYTTCARAPQAHTGSTGSHGLKMRFNKIHQHQSIWRTIFAITLAILNGFRSNFAELLLLDVVQLFLIANQLARA